MATPPPDTSSTVAARDHARAQGTRRAVFQPTVPPADAVGVVDGSGSPVAPERLLWDDIIGPGGYTSRWSFRGARVLRLTDLRRRRLRRPARVQRRRSRSSGSTSPTPSRSSGRPTSARGSLLLSDMGRVLMTIVADTCGAPRRAVRRVDRARATTRGTATAACTATHPNARDLLRAGAGQARARPARHRAERQPLQGRARRAPTAR